ncbi:hypothetical protein RST01_03750 [Rummeliibacillus stabekisii]|nr:hypothetical protein RST01_03750 [Rummeliibacillus stabekisii]
MKFERTVTSFEEGSFYFYSFNINQYINNLITKRKSMIIKNLFNLKFLNCQEIQTYIIKISIKILRALILSAFFVRSIKISS